MPHIPVLLTEVLEYLNPQSNDNFIDCTVGGGGHSLAILKRTAPFGKVLGIDLDSETLKKLAERAGDLKERFILVQSNFRELKKIVQENRFSKINGILLDLGLSSLQLEDRVRGFSFQEEGFLDLRFGDGQRPTAAWILNNYSEGQLRQILRDFGEEKLARPIAQKIIARRRLKKFSKTPELVMLVREVYEQHYRGRSRRHPATKVFQALRLAVNEELKNLEEILPQTLEILEPGGRLVVISYHSLEDRLVKNFFRTTVQTKNSPLVVLTKKPIIPNIKEIGENPRSRSAKLRAAEKKLVCLNS